MDVVEKQAMTLIRQRARALHVTQQKVAGELKVSLPTVKRWWAGRGINVTVLNKICALLGMSLSQLFAEMEGGTSTYIYTLEQERMLVSQPTLLALFDLLVSGESVSSIRRKYSLDDGHLVAMLLKLDKVGLIELGPYNRIKLKHRGEPQWIVGGPLSTKYRRRMIESFLGEHSKSETSFFVHGYLPEDVVLLKGKIKELENLMLTCNARGSNNIDATKSYGAYIRLKEFEWDVRDVLRPEK